MICLLIAPFYFLKLWKRGNWREGFGQRFGKYDSRLKQRLTNRHVIWMHAVSVGEVNVCTQLIKELEPRIPNLKIVVSTTTTTGMQVLRKKVPQHIEKIYYPIDRSRYVKRAMAVILPEAFLLIESEIWPNFLWQIINRRIPLFLVNARFSEKSFRGYRRYAFLFRKIFEGFSGVGVQRKEDIPQLKQLGFREDSLCVVGNLKFDASPISEQRKLDVPGMLKQLGVASNAHVIVAGSTHAGEEALMAEIYNHLKKEFPDLFLIMVPRHFERGKEVGGQLQQKGLRFIYRNQVTAKTRYAQDELDCLLVNTTGELKLFYEVATVIFVGKSMMAKGGQSPIEPGEFAKAMVFGPHMENFPGITEAFVKNEAAVQVNDEKELEEALADLLRNPEKRMRIGKNSARVVSQNQGAVARTIDMIVRHLKVSGKDMYFPPSADSDN